MSHSRRASRVKADSGGAPKGRGRSGPKHGFSLATPPRSYRTRGKRGPGGFWCACDDPPTWKREEAALKALCRSDDDWRLLKSELRSLRERAANGDLFFGKDSEVYRSVTADLVLELRFRQRLQFPGGRRVVRLYFSEPASIPSALVAAKIAGKPATGPGLELQDEHMQDAQLRILKFLGL